MSDVKFALNTMPPMGDEEIQKVMDDMKEAGDKHLEEHPEEIPKMLGVSEQK